MPVRSNRPCETCKEYYSSKHFIEHEKKCRGCTRCANFYTTKPEDLESHEKVCGTNLGYSCEKCGRIFRSKSNCSDHEGKCRPCHRHCGKSFVPSAQNQAHHDLNCSKVNQLEQPRYTQPAQNPTPVPIPVIPHTITRLASNGLPSPTPSNSNNSKANDSTPEPDDTLGFSDDCDITCASGLQPFSEEGRRIVTDYIPHAEKALKECKVMYATLHHTSGKGTRAKEDSVELSTYLSEASVGSPISAEEFLRMETCDLPRNKFIVCNMADAIRIFDRAPPRIPLVIKGSITRRLTISEFITLLELKPSLDVHDFGANVKKYGYTPKRMDSKAAIRLFEARRNGKGEPLNFLNIALVKDNVVPECLLNRIDYKMIELSRSDNGKSEIPGFSDFDECKGFHLLATKGAAHMPHIDRHGVYTTVYSEEGRKVWMVWIKADIEEVSASHLVSGGGVAILIDEGDLLIQPPNIFHAPITLDDCLMTGTMHWNSSQLLEILRSTKREVKTSWLTNEAMARQFTPKMRTLLEIWKKSPGQICWPPPEDMKECIEILEVCMPESTRV